MRLSMTLPFEGKVFKEKKKKKRCAHTPEFKKLKLVVRLITGEAWITAIFRAVNLMETELLNGENAGERQQGDAGSLKMHFGPNMGPIVWLAQLLWHMFERHLTFHSSPPHKNTHTSPTETTGCGGASFSPSIRNFAKQ